MAEGDGLLSFNFRADRIRELLAALLDPAFDGFPRQAPKLAAAVTLTRYSDELAPLTDVVFAPQAMDAILGEAVSHAGKRQLRMAETEKYPHVTYFLNGGRETPFAGEERIMVPSPKVATYDLQPEMSAPELTARAVAAIGTGQFDLVVLNFANADMVGHTGRPARRDRRGAGGRCRPRRDRGRGGGVGRRPAGHGRPRQRRADARCRHRRAAHGAHHQSRARAAVAARGPSGCATAAWPTSPPQCWR